MSNRKFYKSIVTVEVLSEEPISFQSLSDVEYHITDGHCSGIWEQGVWSTLTGKQCAEALSSQGSDPEFFLLNDAGEDIEEEDEDED